MSSGKVIKSFDEDLDDDNDQSISHLVLSFYLFQCQYFFSHGTLLVFQGRRNSEGLLGDLSPLPLIKYAK